MCSFHGVLLATFTDQISLGTLVIGVIVVILFGMATLRDKQISRWRELYELADTERKELTADLSEAKELLADQKEAIAKLEALQMPVRVIEALSQSTEDSHHRYEELMKQHQTHERRAQKRFEESQVNAQRRYESTLSVLQLIADRLGPDTNGHQEH